MSAIPRGMNAATLRRMQQRMIQEGYKDPEEEEQGSSSDSGNPAEDPAAADKDAHRNVIHPGSSDASYAQREEELLAQYRRELEQRQEASDRQRSSRTGTYTTEDPTTTDSELVELTQRFNGGGDGNNDGPNEDMWQCDCGHESPLTHNFCGVCGHAQPNDWWCDRCQLENPHYHRFCSSCGNPNCEYEDMSAIRPPTTILQHQPNMYGGCEASVLTEDNDAEIERAMARMGIQTQQQQQQSRRHPQPWDCEDDAVTFADDADDMVSRVSRQQPRRPQQQLRAPPKPKGWTCEVCTFHNENDCFLSCEMCGSHRPASPSNAGGEQHMPEPLQPQQHQQPQRQQPQPIPSQSQRRQPFDDAASKESGDNKKEKEMRFTDLLQMHAGRYESLTGGQPQQQPQQGGGQQQQQPQQQEAETDLELAMIYAQQERMLAEYQNQQRL